MAVALFWWHMDLKMSVANGAKRAQAAIASNFKGGQMKSDSDSATFLSPNLVALIKCLPRGKSNTQVIVIAAGNDGAATRGAMEQLRDGMRSGILE
jgi:hypothetical protein